MKNNHFNILIVEDEAIVAADLAIRLNTSGYFVVDIADNYDDAINLFKKHLPDLVLLDITIKGKKNGIDIANSINSLAPTPFIFITAHTDADTIEKAKNTFPSAYLVKPFTTSHLLISAELAIHNFAYQKKGIFAEQEINENTSNDIYPKQDYLFIKEGYTFIKVYQQDILYIEAKDNYVQITTDVKSHLIRCTISKVIERLNSSSIIRVHRSFCINLNKVNSFSESDINIGNYSIPIGRNYKEDFFKNYEMKN